ncbi:HAD hydrolase family protein [Acidipropionibacterium jensenii]|uniref:HAD hydrolase family protein n=1 Tax=Acidipropionibacterium jensenii TaxID=1749 RepID=UPI00264A4B8F|nr:HAD family hydrolase [Acidipropionibacterium jensenii]MDN5995532.1 Cof-type HAD-IIB family hydrolase [Acidipropionibacterium jensenii]
MSTVLATDLDGTVVFEDGIHPADREAIGSWLAAGNTLVLATGKSVDAVRLVWHEVGMPDPDYVIAFTGSVITDGSLHPLAVTAHQPGLLDDIVSLVDGEPLVLYASDIEHDYVVAARVSQHSSIVPRSYPADLDRLRHTDLFGIPLYIPDPTVMDRVEPALRKLCAGRAEVHRNQNFLDVVPPGVSKGAGLRRLLTGLIGDHGDVYTLRDSWNDLSMHEVADHPVALAHSPAQVRAHCEATVDSAAQLIAQILKEQK